MASILLLGPDWRTHYIRDAISSKASIFCADNLSQLDDIEKFDFLVTCGFDKRIKKDVLDLFEPKKRLNIHATYLPFGKGIGTALFSLLFPVTIGSTIHILRPQIDQGEILTQSIMDPPDLNETQRQLYHRWVKHAADLFIDNFDSILNCDLEYCIQSAEFKTPYLSRNDSELLVSLLPKTWDSTVEQVYDLSLLLSLRSAFNEKCTE